MQLNPKFTFDNFVVGHSNEMPYAVSKRVSESMSTTYNPIYLYGQLAWVKLIY